MIILDIVLAFPLVLQMLFVDFLSIQTVFLYLVIRSRVSLFLKILLQIFDSIHIILILILLLFALLVLVISLSFSFISICQYPLAKSILLNHFASLNCSSTSSILGSGCASVIVMLFIFL